MNEIIDINKYYLINWEVYLDNENKNKRFFEIFKRR